MSRAATLVTARARRFVVASPLFLIAWAVAAVLSLPAQTTVPLALHGFVFTMVFGKAYALIPSYFDTTLSPVWAPTVHLPLTVLGAIGYATRGIPAVPTWIGTAGAVLWAAGIVVFVATILWTNRGNLTGAATGTSQVNEARQRLDRRANAAIPIVLAYLLAGAYVTAATATRLPTGGVPAAGGTHLLAAGGATLLVFAVGFRLFPRFLAATPPRGVPPLVLTTGAVAPAILAVSLYGGTVFQLGATLQAIAITGFAIAYAILFRRSDRDRIGLYGPLLGVTAALVGVGLGLQFAFAEITTPLVVIHRRLNLVGFLGLTIIGAAYQFYPPAVGTFPGAGDRLAAGTLAAVAGGLALQVVGTLVGGDVIVTVGEAGVVVGALGYGYVLLGLLRQRGH